MGLDSPDFYALLDFHNRNGLIWGDFTRKPPKYAKGERI